MELIDQGHRGISRHLDLTRMQVLGLVARRGPVRPNEIAAELGLTASATSRQLAALERAGQVEVAADPADGRTFLVTRTAKGREEADTAVRAGVAAFAAVIEDWSDEDVATATALITRLNQAWARPRPAANTGPGWRRARKAE